MEEAMPSAKLRVRDVALWTALQLERKRSELTLDFGLLREFALLLRRLAREVETGKASPWPDSLLDYKGEVVLLVREYAGNPELTQVQVLEHVRLVATQLEAVAIGGVPREHDELMRFCLAVHDMKTDDERTEERIRGSGLFLTSRNDGTARLVA
jgi:hypothetical protein